GRSRFASGARRPRGAHPLSLHAGLPIAGPEEPTEEPGGPSEPGADGTDDGTVPEEPGGAGPMPETGAPVTLAASIAVLTLLLGADRKSTRPNSRHGSTPSAVRRLDKNTQ